ncbi:hypothetical protein HHI36_014699 [Cryptolaemus montrouzieri]|uniref:VLRF1 domain-containing protein n=1 Tax=Cryptolaemus montrouzieri TaxID=559131 RepID=A0ABD2N4D2_9CUCU
MESGNVFQDKFIEILKAGDIKCILLENSEENVASTPEKSWKSQNPNKMSCSYCHIDFSDVSVQREHYKLDWHRFNLKQSLTGKDPITEQDFELKIGNDDLSSISGSDSEKEDTLNTYAAAQGKIFLQSGNQIFSLYKCLAFKKKDELDDKLMIKNLNASCVYKEWTVLMVSGGHFAGAVFKGMEPIVHKTFHCYTVRQGQGGSQSSRDNKSGGSNAKSAGASLRRYNEQAFVQHVRKIVKQWEQEIWRSDLIFYRASGPYNKSILFGGSNPILEKSDKLRKIPFMTRRATFAEVLRVHKELSSMQIYENMEFVVKHLDKHRLLCRDSKRNRSRSSQINRAKSREIVSRPLPINYSPENNSRVNSCSENEETEHVTLDSSLQEISFDHLQEFEIMEEPREKTSKKKKPKKSKTKKLQEQETERKNELIDILCQGRIFKLKDLIENIGTNSDENELNVKKELQINFVNEILDEEGNSMMHIAAINEHKELVKFLLENDCDPCKRNKKLQTPYSATSSKEVREVMKEFAKQYPEKYNYNKAQIPLNTLTPEELLEKKKIQKKLNVKKTR